jgi:hypothetical protein
MLPEVEKALSPLFERKKEELIKLGYPETAIERARNWAMGWAQGVARWFDSGAPIEEQRRVQAKVGLKALDKMDEWIMGFREAFFPERPLPPPPPFVPTEEELTRIETELGIKLRPISFPLPAGLTGFIEMKEEKSAEKLGEIVGGK